MAKTQVEGAKNRGWLKNPRTVEYMLRSAKHPMVRAFIQGFINEEMEKMEGSGVKGENNGDAGTQRGKKVSAQGNDGNRATPEGQDNGKEKEVTSEEEEDDEKDDEEDENSEVKDEEVMDEEMSKAMRKGEMASMMKELGLGDIEINPPDVSNASQGDSKRGSRESRGKGKGRREVGGKNRGAEREDDREDVGDATRATKSGGLAELDGEEHALKSFTDEKTRGEEGGDSLRSGSRQGGERGGGGSEGGVGRRRRRMLLLPDGVPQKGSRSAYGGQEWEAARGTGDENETDEVTEELGAEYRYSEMDGGGRGEAGRRRKLVDVVAGGDADDEEGLKTKSVRCARLQVRSCADVTDHVSCCPSILTRWLLHPSVVTIPLPLLMSTTGSLLPWFHILNGHQQMRNHP